MVKTYESRIPPSPNLDKVTEGLDKLNNWFDWMIYFFKYIGFIKYTHSVKVHTCRLQFSTLLMADACWPLFMLLLPFLLRFSSHTQFYLFVRSCFLKFYMVNMKITLMKHSKSKKRMMEGKMSGERWVLIDDKNLFEGLQTKRSLKTNLL